MPLGPYEDFGQCVQAQKMKGHSDESARRICGEMQQKIEGSSPNMQYGFDGQMSEQKMKEEEQQPQEVVISFEQAQAITEAIMSKDINMVTRLWSEIVDIEETEPTSAVPAAE